MQHESGRETELKLRLSSKADVEALRRALGGDARPAVLQRNHFFDSADGVLTRSHYACRLRSESDSFVVTVKGPGTRSEDGLVVDRAEEERRVSAHDAERMLRGAESPLAAFESAAEPRVVAAVRELLGPERLVSIGGFDNLRTRVSADLAIGGKRTPLVFELDETIFPGGRVDYELEVELPARVSPVELRAALSGLLQAVGIEARASQSKLQRFLAARLF